MNRSVKLFLAIILSFAVFGFAATLFAGSNENIYGHAWSSNVGWISFNNCIDDPAAGTNCRTQSYGVSFLPQVTSGGTGSGHAWSSNVGWISFNNQGCPSDVTGCTGGTYIDWKNPNADGSFNVKGWARACAVYKAGCSGELKDSDSNGGWDGYIALNGVAANNDPFGVKIANSAFSGYAWGGEVVGWVSFLGLRLSTTTPTLTLWADPDSISVGSSTTLHATATGITGTCSIDSGIGSVVMTNSDGTWTMTPVSTGSLVSNKTYTITCTNATTSAPMTASTTVSVTGEDACTANPSAPGCSGNTGTCTDGLKNGDETGIDIGGRCGGGTGTCTDGLKNGDETGIDIGGRCGALPACSDGIDNDGDGFTDFGSGPTNDPGCKSATDNDERDVKIIEF